MKSIFLPFFLIALCLCSCETSTHSTDVHRHADGDSISLVARDKSGPDSNALRSAVNTNDRENWQKPQMVISRLGDLSVKTVADIGAGTGYFTMRLARKSKKVIAIDIDEQFLSYIQRRLSSTRDAQELDIETRLTQADDPSLKPNEADLVLIVNTYAYIQDRVTYFEKVWSGIAENGQLVIVDFKKELLPVGPPVEEKIDVQAVISELDSAGFGPFVVDSTALTYQYMLTAYKSPSNPESP